MSKLDLLPKKKRLNVVIITVALIVIIVGAASSFCLSSASDYPTLSSMAGTYSNASTGSTITLNEDGSALFDTHDGIWHIVNATTFEVSYTTISGRQYFEFKITNNGFTSVETGNLYVKTASASPSPTTSASASPSPTVPEFSNASLAIIVTMIAVATCTVALAVKKGEKRFNQQAL
jgi:hypothetical protein